MGNDFGLLFAGFMIMLGLFSISKAVEKLADAIEKFTKQFKPNKGE